MLEKLFSPCKIGSLEIKNRLVVSPMVCNFCTEDGNATERFISYHEEKAKGGWGLITIENYAIAPEGRGFSNMACMFDDDNMESHSELVKRIHQYDSKLVAQIFHAGRQTNHTANRGMQLLAPSPIPCPDNQEMPHEMTVSEIRQVVAKYGDAAGRLYRIGFDGVEIHGGHGYLIAQFMSSYSNKRVDEYGGVLFNRMRFVKEIIDDVRAKTSPDFPIVFRISSEEKMPGGRSIHDTVAIAMLLEQWGVNAIDVTIGTYGEDSTVPTMAVEHAWNAEASEEIKKAVQIPVMIVGRINDPIIAESVIRSGKADMIVMGRGSLADPYLPAKAKSGDFDAIRQCIGCMQGCIGRLGAGPIACLVNPQLGFESEVIEKTANPKTVWVIGAGPAGIEAARAAALSGHKVTLFEKRNRLGGQFTLAAYSLMKGELSTYAAWAKGELSRLGVDVKLNTGFTADMAAGGKPDTVIVATGSVPFIPDSIQINSDMTLGDKTLGDMTLSAQDLLDGYGEPGKKCAVLGGGLVGIETAIYLGWLGRDVTVYEMLPQIAPGVEVALLPHLLNLLDKYNVKVITDALVEKIDGGTVTFNISGKQESSLYDTVVLAFGAKSENALADSLKGIVNEVKVVGDAHSPKMALDATREGFVAGSTLD